MISLNTYGHRQIVEQLLKILYAEYCLRRRRNCQVAAQCGAVTETYQRSAGATRLPEGTRETGESDGHSATTTEGFR